MNIETAWFVQNALENVHCIDLGISFKEMAWYLVLLLSWVSIFSFCRTTLNVLSIKWAEKTNEEIEYKNTIRTRLWTTTVGLGVTWEQIMNEMKEVVVVIQKNVKKWIEQTWDKFHEVDTDIDMSFRIMVDEIFVILPNLKMIV